MRAAIHVVGALSVVAWTFVLVSFIAGAQRLYSIGDNPVNVVIYLVLPTLVASLVLTGTTILAYARRMNGLALTTAVTSFTTAVFTFAFFRLIAMAAL
jgi:hypothetical protein